MNLPRPATLKKYGLTEQEWIALYESQGGICPICEKPLDTRVCVDHYHAKGYKKMSPEKKRFYIRGLVHWVCNHYYLGRGITVQRAYNVANYLERFENKINNENKNRVKRTKDT